MRCDMLILITSPRSAAECSAAAEASAARERPREDVRIFGPEAEAAGRLLTPTERTLCAELRLSPQQCRPPRHNATPTPFGDLKARREQ